MWQDVVKQEFNNKIVKIYYIFSESFMDFFYFFCIFFAFFLIIFFSGFLSGLMNNQEVIPLSPSLGDKKWLEFKELEWKNPPLTPPRRGKEIRRNIR
jgi:hypothetical protein